ncbi:hypothetical protein Mapa_013874 [Marchantia paleacea]|nr:hypothetical protein Mapa_013874 [Marchantia paleacea]
MWSGSSINLRGLWYMTADGEADLDDQELAIVGGQGHFRGATGSVFYKRVQSQPQSIFFVTCHIYLPDFLFNGEVIEVDLNEQFKTNAKPEYFQGHGELIKESTSTT